jgi:ankyrin repeat protein
MTLPEELRQDSTLLHELARKGEVENMARLLRQGADLHARDEDLFSTPLGHAAKYGQLRMVEFLLRQGARVRLPDDPPWATPLAWAERRGHAEVAEVLRHHALWGVLLLRRALEDYDALAAELVDACTSGSEETLRRLKQELRLDRTPTPDHIREIVRRRAPGMKDDGELGWSEAREWVAGREGFASWGELETHLTWLTREHQRVTAWKAVDQAVADGDDEGLEKLMAEHAEPLAKRPKGAYPACGTAFDFTKGARTLIAREHHFETWVAFARHQAERRDPSTPTAAFENAVEAVVSGNAEQLRQLVAADSRLIHARSSRSHQATLLHYVGANGVEGFRQRTPPNAVEIAEVLLGAGAEVDAVAAMYGGSTVLGLAATSVHPWLAGVQLNLLRTLLAQGASIDHPQGGANPLTPILGCLANGRQDAAEFLAAHGASLDLEAAAGVGRLELVQSYVDDQGGLRNGATEAQLQSGVHWACEYGRTEVVQYLLTRGADLARLHRGRTGLHWAAYGGHLEIVRLLLNQGAPVDVVDEHYRTTPLGWALYGWFQPPAAGALQRYPAVVEELVKRGAVVRPEWRADVRVRNDLLMLRALA